MKNVIENFLRISFRMLLQHLTKNNPAYERGDDFMFDVQSYLELPDEPNNCIYEDYRDKILINPVVFICLLKQNRKEEMKNIHMLHISLYDKYGEDWADKIWFNDEKLRDAIKLLYIRDYPGKDVINSKQRERKDLYKRIMTTEE